MTADRDGKEDALPDSTIPLDAAGMARLLAHARKHDNLEAWVGCAMQWINATAAEVERLPPLAEGGAGAATDRDRDWIVSLADALGHDSGLSVAIVPTPEACRAMLSAVRAKVIEECARVADMHAGYCARFSDGEKARTAASIADMIRALSSTAGGGRG